MPSEVSRSRPRVVIIGFVWPEPDSSAAGQNMLGIINSFLNADWQVTFMTAARGSEHAVDLPAMGVAKESIALNCSSFDARITEIQPDVVIFDRFMTEEQFASRVREACPQAMRILNTEDLHSLRHARQMQVRGGNPSSMPDSPCTDDNSIREIAAILRSDLTLIISPEEKAYLLNQYSIDDTLLLHVPLFTGSTTVPAYAFSQRRDFMFIGNFRHAPNWDAVLQLQQIWPHIRKQLPKAELNIYGAYPPKKAMTMDSPAKGFRVRGWAKSAEQEIAAHRVMLAPIRFGAGVKGKLVGAMQYGTPSVTTTIGAEGLKSDSPWPGIISDNQQGFIDAAVSLYTEQHKWETCSGLGMRQFAKQFDNASNQQHLITAVEKRRAELESWRQRQFLQSLLWHQTLKASQYMTQWIEAKNKHPETLPRAW